MIIIYNDTNRSLARRPDLMMINKKKRPYHIMDFAIPAGHRVKIKDSEKRDKYFDLARELKKSCGTQE